MRSWRQVFIIGFLLLIATIAFLLFFPFTETIAFYQEDREELLAFLPIQDDNSFQIQYTHSIHLTDVVETYELRNKEIVQTELQFENFAIGMPSNVEGNEKFVEKDGKYLIKNMNRRFPYIDLRVGLVRADHRVIYKESVYKLSNYIRPGTWVRIKPAKLSYWERLKGVEISEQRKI